MNRRLYLNPSAVIAMPLLRQRHHLLRGGVGIEAVVLVKHGDGTGDISLDACLRHTLANIVRKVIHIRNGGGAEAQAFRQPQQGRSPDGAAVPQILLGEDIVGKPVLKIMVIAIASQRSHGQMCMAVNKSGHQHHASAVDHPRRLLLGRLLGNVGNLTVGHAHIGSRNYRELVNHGHSGNIGKQCVHRTPFKSARHSAAVVT